MGKITMTRVDYRLIHGQVITKWVKQANADQIIIINNELSKDEFMASIYVMAAPPSIKVKVLSIEQAIKSYEENAFGNGNIFVLFRNIDDAYKVYDLGVKYNSLNIGGIASAAGKKSIIGQVSMAKEEYEKLGELDAASVSVNVQVLPNEVKVSFNDLKKHFN